MALTARRFKYDARLEEILAGGHLLKVPPSGLPPYESGKHVRKIQQALVDLGFSLPQHGVDSVYGPETRDAVRAFQQRERLNPADGIVGKDTMRQLDGLFAGEPGLVAPTPGVGEVSIDDFLEAVQAAETANPADTPEQFLTRLRQMYYPGPEANLVKQAAFDQLLPTAPIYESPNVRRLLRPTGMDQGMFGRLTQKAYENARPPLPPDNPGPYLLDQTGAQIDVGHVLLTLDAVFHPTTGTPYSNYGVPAIDPAWWVADLGIAAVWAEQDGAPDAPRRLTALANGEPDFPGYYEMSAPDADLVGDIDGWNIAQLWQGVGGPLSRPLIQYYLDGDTVPGGYRRRYRDFIAATFGSPDDPAGWRNGRALWEKRINRFNDLYHDTPNTVLTPPPPRSWRFTPAALDTFFTWLEGALQFEVANFD